MPVLFTGSYHQRQNIKRKLLKGKIPLRVTGSEKTGFRLAGEWGDKVVPIGQTFDKQGEAIQVGLDRYKTKAIKLTDSVRRTKSQTAKPSAALI